MINLLKKFFIRTKQVKNNNKVNWTEGPHYFGHEYVEDKDQVDVTITAVFFSGGLITPFNFFLYKNAVFVQQSGSVLELSLNRKISKKLWHDILTEHRGENFILGYLSVVLPRVNQEIEIQKYARGHLLMKTFSILDMANLHIIYQNKKIQLLWPEAIGDFPFKKALKYDVPYIIDFIDAIDSYFRGNHTESVRKIITCVENFFSYNKIPGKGLKNKIRDNIPDNNIGGRVIKNNLLFVYKVRNKIVHNKFRIKYSNGWFAKKAIGTAQYLIQSPLNSDGDIIEYSNSLVGQFLMLDNRYGISSLNNLDHLGSIQMDRNDIESKIIKTPEDLDNSVFSSLEISNDDRSRIFKK